MRSHVVSRASCAVVAHELDLGRGSPRISDGEDASRLAKNRNVLAALLEAVLGALFLEHGFAPIEEAIVDAFSERIEYALTTYVDHKTELQEALARLRPAGRTTRSSRRSGRRTSGTSRAPRSSTASELGAGEGGSKKAAEQEAARKRSKLWHPEGVTSPEALRQALDERLDEQDEKARAAGDLRALRAGRGRPARPGARRKR